MINLENKVAIVTGGSKGTVEKTSPVDREKLYAVNVNSVYSCSHFAVGYMKKTGGGIKENVSSIAADTGLAGSYV